MSKESTKNWERPWSTEEIVENADNWNLACDSALLNTLKAFGDKILKKAEYVNNEIENLNQQLSKVNLQVDLARNEFSSLRNTQFVECRVYEEDETLPTVQPTQEETHDVPEEETIEDFKEAVALGLGVLEDYYDRVKVTVSDSEEEDEVEPSYIYTRKDPYINRRLPHLIGSEEWHKKWHVGLIDTDSENENSEKSSDSESEDEFSQNNDCSDATSELSDLSGFKGLKEKAVYVRSGNAVTNDILAAASDLDNSTQPTQKLSFAEQLAAKLGNVIKEKEINGNEPEVNRRPIQNKPSDYGALFSNEPPPLDGAGSKSLFDDEEENDLWSDSGNKTQFVDSSKVIDKPEVSVGKGLFDEDDASDDDFLAAPKTASQQNNQPYLQSKKPLVPVFDEEPPALDELVKEKKKPLGGVSLFGTTDILKDQAIGKILKERKDILPNDENESESKKANEEPSRDKVASNSVPESKKPIEKIISAVPKLESKQSLFDDIFGDDLFSSIDGKKGDLFSDDETLFSPNKNSKDDSIETKKDEVFLNKKINNVDENEKRLKTEENNKEISSLFDDLDDADDLFWDVSKKKDGTKNKKSISLLFDDDDEDFAIFKTKNSKESTEIKPKVFETEDRKVNDEDKNEINRNFKESKQQISLFDDDIEDEDDLFLSFSNKKRTSDSSIPIETNRKEEPEHTKAVTEIVSENSEESQNHVEVVVEEIPSEPFESVNFNESSKNLFDDGEIETVEKKENESVPRIAVDEEARGSLSNSKSDSTRNEFKGSPGVLNVNLMDWIPPPDEDWETYSDNAFDDMEQVNDGFQSQASSLFDNEPPSLIFNEHSEDQFKTESSNIFSSAISDLEEDQSFHSNKETNASLSPPQIDEKISHSSLTPKEEQERVVIETEKKEIEVKPPILKEKSGDTKNTLKPPLFDMPPSDSLLEGILDGDETDFLFSETLRDNTENVEIRENDKIRDRSADKFDENEIGSSGPVGREEDMSNISKITEKLQQISSKEEERTRPVAVPGKLSHNLKINVGALLPGSTKPTIPKRGRVSDEDETISKSLPASRFSLNEGDFERTKPMSIDGASDRDLTKTRQYHSLEKSVSFDEGTNVEILKSVTKDRAKILIKRKPSSRRARQKSLRDSMSEFRLEDPIPDENQTQKIDNDTSTVEQAAVNPSEFTNEQLIPNKIGDNSRDFFKTVEKTFKDVNETNNISIMVSKDDFNSTKVQNEQSSDLFDSSDEDNLFKSTKTMGSKSGNSGITIIGKIAEKPSSNIEKSKSGSLFDFSDDEDFLENFSDGIDKKLDKKITIKSTNILFDEEDDDIFGTDGTVGSKTKQDLKPTVINKKPPKLSSLRKLEKVEGEIDPLSALLK